MKTVSVVGIGNLGSAFAKALLDVSGIRGWHVGLCDSVYERAASVAKGQSDASVWTAAEAVEKSDAIVLVVKPHGIVPLLKSLRPALDSRTEPLTVISAAAGVRLRSIANEVRPMDRLVRVMPNILVHVREAFTGVYSVSRDGRHHADELFSTVGQVLQCEQEAELDIITAVGGSGPGFVSFLAQGLIDGAVKMGLSRPDARRIVVSLLSGTARYLDHTGIHPAELCDRVSSPAGTTIEGLHVLESHAVKAALIEAVETACARATELGSK